jgi:WD40 repeat protein
VGLSNGNAYRVDLDTNTNLQTYTSSSAVNKILAINNQNVLTAHDDSFVRLWNMQTGTYICSYNHSGAVKSMATLPGGFLATGACDTNVYIWNLTAGWDFRNLTGHSGCVNDLAVNNVTGQLISIGSNDGLVILWSTVDYSLTWTSARLDTTLYAIAVLDNGNYLIASNLHIFMFTSANVMTTYTPSASSVPVRSLMVYANGVTVACGMSDGSIQLFDSSTGQISAPEVVMGSAGSSVLSMAWIDFSSNYFISGADSNTYNLWYSDGTNLGQVRNNNFTSPIRSVYFLNTSICEILNFFLNFFFKTGFQRSCFFVSH